MVVFWEDKLWGSDRYSWNKSVIIYMISHSRDFPGSPVVKNPPSNAGDVGFIPGRGTKSHTLWGN